MKNGAERLSLGEVESLVHDALRRAGASSSAAAATAQAVRRSERNGDKIGGMQRVPRLIEGIRLAAIGGDAVPTMEPVRQGRVRLSAQKGLSDAAFELGCNALGDVVEREGYGQLFIEETGDLPMPRPWIEGLAETNLMVFSLGGWPANAAAMPRGQGQVHFEAGILPAAAAAQMQEFLTSVAPEPVRDVEDPYLEPYRGRVCLLAFASGNVKADAREDSLSEFSLTGQSLRRQQADTHGVDVPSALLTLILTA